VDRLRRAGVLVDDEDGRIRFANRRTQDRLAVPLFAERLSSDFVDRRLMWDQAINALGSIGAPAVPALVRALHDPDPAVSRGAAHALRGDPADRGERAAHHVAAAP
jgi:HEAT repeat protein